MRLAIRKEDEVFIILIIFEDKISFLENQI